MEVQRMTVVVPLSIPRMASETTGTSWVGLLLLNYAVRASSFILEAVQMNGELRNAEAWPTRVRCNLWNRHCPFEISPTEHAWKHTLLATKAISTLCAWSYKLYILLQQGNLAPAFSPFSGFPLFWNAFLSFTHIQPTAGEKWNALFVAGFWLPETKPVSQDWLGGLEFEFEYLCKQMISGKIAVVPYQLQKTR